MVNNIFAERNFSLYNAQPKAITANILEAQKSSVAAINSNASEATITQVSHEPFNATGVYFELLQLISNINFQNIESDMQNKLKNIKSIGEFNTLKNKLTIQYAAEIKKMVEAKIAEVAKKIHNASAFTLLFSYAKLIAGIALIAVAIVATPVTGGLSTAVGVVGGGILIEEGIVGLGEGVNMFQLADDLQSGKVGIDELQQKLEHDMNMVNYGLLGLLGKDTAKWASLGTDILMAVLTLGTSILEVAALKMAMTQVAKTVESSIQTAVAKAVETAATQTIKNVAQNIAKEISEDITKTITKDVAKSTIQKIIKEAVMKSLTRIEQRGVSEIGDEITNEITRAVSAALKKQTTSLLARIILKTLDMTAQSAGMILQVVNTAGAFDGKKPEPSEENKESTYNWGQKITQATQMGFVGGVIFMALDNLMRINHFDQKNPVVTSILETGLSLSWTMGFMVWNAKTAKNFSGFEDLMAQPDSSYFSKVMSSIAKRCQSGGFMLSQVMLGFNMTLHQVLNSATSGTLGFMTSSVQYSVAESTNDTKRMEEILDMAMKAIESISNSNAQASKLLDEHTASTIQEQQQFINSNLAGQIFGY